MKKRLFEQFDKEFLSYCKESCLDRLTLYDSIVYLLIFLLSSDVINNKEFQFLAAASNAVCYGQ